MHGCGKDCLILIPFRLPQISCFTLRLKCFSFDSDNFPKCGDLTPALFPQPAEDKSSPTNTPVFPLVPSSYRVLLVLYILIHGQVLLFSLWCSACTSVSEGVFLMYPWREMYPKSTYSSAILFDLPWGFFTKNEKSVYQRFVIMSPSGVTTTAIFFFFLVQLLS